MKVLKFVLLGIGSFFIVNGCGQEIEFNIYDSWHVIEISNNDVAAHVQIFWFSEDYAGYYFHGNLDEFWPFEWDWTIDGEEIEIKWVAACDRWGGDEFLAVLSEINVTEEFLECKINGVDVVMRRME